jgi:hypothetical protein
VDVDSIPEHLQDLYKKSADGLNQEQTTKVESLLKDYNDVFSKGSGDIGRAKGTKHKICTGDAQPIKQAPRRLPMRKRDEAIQAVEEMEKQGIVEPSMSPWSSPIVLVRKKDGSTRFCVDYRRLNDVTRKDSFPLPRVDITLDALNGAKWFSTLDLKSGYWQVELDPADKEKTAVSFGQGLWQFTVMPFGLGNAPATFERLMEAVLRGLPWKICLVYLDDIIAHAKSFDTHLENLKCVLERLREANLKLNPKKCTLFRTEVTYLGYVVSDEGISADPVKVEAVKAWPPPANIHQVRSFIGLCIYYRRFVPRFSQLAKPLLLLTEKDAVFEWTEQCNQAFQTLKDLLTKAPVLAYPDFDKPLILDTDSSDVAIGATLSQIIDGVEHPISYFSRTLSGPEKKYCVTRKELLAIVLATGHFHHCLYGNHFTIRTDHASLQWLLDFKNPEGQTARWLKKLHQYDFAVLHRRGKLHGNADALSRRPCEETGCKYCEKRDIVEALANEHQSG